MATRVLAAPVTPLRDEGAALDDDAFGPYGDFLAESGVTGLFALGTTGEGILLSPPERRRAAERFIEASAGRLEVVVHCGAQTTAATVALSAHAAEAGADAVAVIPPPYYPLDERELAGHFEAAARACAPLPFFLYEFAARSGYAIPHAVIERLRASAPNLAGLKVSETPWERFEPYLVEGLDVLVGPESLIPLGLAHGAAGVVSGLAGAFPEAVVAVARGSAGEEVAALRAEVQRFPFQAALKRVLGLRGVPIREDVRAPLRPLSPDERVELDSSCERWLASSSPAQAR